MKTEFPGTGGSRLAFIDRLRRLSSPRQADESEELLEDLRQLRASVTQYRALVDRLTLSKGV